MSKWLQESHKRGERFAGWWHVGLGAIYCLLAGLYVLAACQWHFPSAREHFQEAKKRQPPIPLSCSDWDEEWEEDEPDVAP